MDIYQTPPTQFNKFRSEILRLPGLVAYYPLDEQSGNAINRAPATQGTLNGTPSNVTQGVVGRVGRAYGFNGTTSLVTIADADVLDLTNTITMFALVNLVGWGSHNGGRILDKDFVTGYIFTLRNPANSSRLAFGASNTLYQGTADTVSLGVPLFVAVTFDKDAGSNQIKMYVNAVLSGTGTRTAALGTNDASLLLGRAADGTGFFDGLIQHVGVVNGIVSGAQLLKLSQLAGLA